MLLRHRGRSRDHPARADRRADGASLSEAAAGRGRRRVSASGARAHPRAHAGRAALPGTAAAHGDGGGGVFRRRGRGTAPGDGIQALREADAAARRPVAQRHGAARASSASRRKRSSARLRRLRSMDFPNRTPRASRCSSMPAPTSRRIIRRRSIPRSSTTSRWGSITRRRSSRTRSGTASAFRPSMCRSRIGTAAWIPMGACGWG